MSRAGQRVRGRVNVLYSCGHDREFEKGAHAPHLFDDVFCLKCNTGVTIVSILPEWQYKCKNCRSGRYYGQDETSCRRDARAHVVSHASHSVGVYRGTDLADSFGLTDLRPDKHGLREAARTNAALLKRINGL